MMKKPICLLLLLSMIWACGESVHFEQPQPAQAKALNKIPRSLRGKYISDDSTFVTISKKRITERSIYEVEEPIDSLIAEIEADNDLIITHRSKTRLKVRNLEDSMEVKLDIKEGIGRGKIELSETLFQISDRQVLKEQNGSYFFNVLRPEDSAWILRWLHQSGDSLIISKINSTGNSSDQQLLPATDHIKKSGKIKGSKIDPNPSQLTELMEKHSKVTKVLRPVGK